MSDDGRERSRSPTRWLRWLDDTDTRRIEEFGGKTASLSRLRAAGVSTPDGFAIGASAYIEAIRLAGIERRLAEAVQLAEREPALASEQSALCRELINNMTIPAELEQEIVVAYGQLASRHAEKCPKMAVRSSAIREDSSSASGAGQYETVLGVSGMKAVLAAVKTCWASLFSEHAMHYRAGQGIALAETPMAVAIIELVEAHASGVAFSVHPVTGKPDRMVVESTYGWGEALVQGRITPDHFEVDRDDHRVLQRRVGNKAVISTWNDEGDRIVERQMPEALQRECSLTDAQVKLITRELLAIEREFGGSIDMEWVIPRAREDEAIIVQARPETVHRLTFEELSNRRSGAAFDPIAFAMQKTFGADAKRTKP